MLYLFLNFVAIVIVYLYFANTKKTPQKNFKSSVSAPQASIEQVQTTIDANDSTIDHCEGTAEYRTPEDQVEFNTAGYNITKLTPKQEHLVFDFFHQYEAARAENKSDTVAIYFVNSVGQTMKYRVSTQKDISTLLNAIFGLNKGLSTYLNMLRKNKSSVESGD